jgi:alpha-1,2-mannosyltransferase
MRAPDPPAQGLAQRPTVAQANDGRRRWLWAAALAGVVGWVANAVMLCVFGRGWDLDLRVYLGGGHALLSGADAYVEHFTPLHLPFSYPPFALIVMSPLSLLPTGVVEVLWWCLGALALTASIKITLRAAGAERFTQWTLALGIGGVAAIAAEPVRGGIDLGQINVELMLMVIADLLVVRGRGRGLLVGIAGAIKLTPLYFVLYFAITRDWRALRNSLAAFAILTGGSSLLLPHESSLYFFHELRMPGKFGGLGSVSNQAWAGVFHRTPFLGMPGSSALLVVLCLATTGLVIWVAVLVVERSPVQAMVVIGIGALLVSPISWSHHWCWLVLFPVTAWQLRRDRALLTINLIVLACATLGVYSFFRHGPSRSIASALLVVLAASSLVIWLCHGLRVRASALIAA